MKRKIRSVLCIFMLLTLLLSGCNDSSTFKPAETDASAKNPADFLPAGQWERTYRQKEPRWTFRGIKIPKGEVIDVFYGATVGRSAPPNFCLFEDRFFTDYTELEENYSQVLGEKIESVSEFNFKNDAFYQIKGYESFLLGAEIDSKLLLMVNDNGRTFKKGAALFEDLLKLSGYSYLQIRSIDGWTVCSTEYRDDLNEAYAEEIGDFIRALSEAKVMRTKKIPCKKDEHYSDKATWQITFFTEEGLPLTLQLYEGGYVAFTGIQEVCVKIPEEKIDPLIEIFNTIKQQNGKD